MPDAQRTIRPHDDRVRNVADSALAAPRRGKRQSGLLCSSPLQHISPTTRHSHWRERNPKPIFRSGPVSRPRLTEFLGGGPPGFVAAFAIGLAEPGSTKESLDFLGALDARTASPS